MREVRVRKLPRLRVPKFVKSPGFLIPLFVFSLVGLIMGLPLAIVHHDDSNVDHSELEEQLLLSTWTADNKNFGIKRVYCDPENVDSNGVGIYRCEVNFQGRQNEDVDMMRFDFDLQERWYTVG